LNHGWIGGRQDRPVDLRIGKDPGVEQVEQLNVAIGIPLKNRPLEDLDRKTEQGELAGDRVAKRLDPAAADEVIVEMRIVDLVAGFRKVGRGTGPNRLVEAGQGDGEGQDERQKSDFDGEPFLSCGLANHHWGDPSLRSG
jgi:hypothetical protein